MKIENYKRKSVQKYKNSCIYFIDIDNAIVSQSLVAIYATQYIFIYACLYIQIRCTTEAPAGHVVGCVSVEKYF